MSHEREVVRVLRDSQVVLAIERLMAFGSRAAGASRILSAIQRQQDRWLARPPLQRRAQAGRVVLVSVVVHVLLTSSLGSAPGWMWLLVPALAFAAGLLWWVTGRLGAALEHRPGT